MKKFLAVLVMLLVTTAAHAASLQLGAQIDPMTELRNPVSGSAALEVGHSRLGATLGLRSRLSISGDLLARNRSGLYIGVGIVADRLTNEDFTTSEGSSDSTVTHRPHDSGLHIGDTHVRNGKTVTSLRSYNRSLTVFGQEYGLSPSFFVGLPLPGGLFIESRVLYDGDGDMTNRSSIGIRF